ncbi:MAG: DegV family protein [Bacilli bacterium]
MSKYVIITDATCDLPQRYVEQFSLDYIPMEVNFGEEVHLQYLDERALKLQDFYQRLDGGELAKTTLITAHTFTEKFRPYLKKGLDVLYTGISSGLSATWMQAIMAREELLEEFPDRKIVLVDSMSASVAEGMIVLEALKRQEAGATIDEVASHIEVLRQKVLAYLVPENLETLRRGGRVSAAKALIGDLVGVKPILSLTDEGKLAPIGKGRGFKKAFLEILDMSEKQVGKAYKGQVIIAHANNESSANLLGKMFQERFGTESEVVTVPLGPVISAHTGTGAVCIVLKGTKR